jgi:hypothetical protein
VGSLGIDLAEFDDPAQAQAYGEEAQRHEAHEEAMLRERAESPASSRSAEGA